MPIPGRREESALRLRLLRPPWGEAAYLIAAAAYADLALRPLARPLLDLAGVGRWVYAASALGLMLAQAMLLDRLAAALGRLDRV